MGSVGTPKNNTDVFPQSTVSFSVPHQKRDQLNHEGSVKRKRACNKTTDNLLSAKGKHTTTTTMMKYPRIIMSKQIQVAIL